MSLNTWRQTVISMRGDGTALTAAAAASLLQGASATRGKYTLPANIFLPDTKLIVQASGRISCAVTTPGTARFDLRFGGTVVFDTLAMNLNIVAKTNVHWHLMLELFCQAAGDGTTATLFPGRCTWMSEAVIGAALPTVGTSGTLLVPVATAPTVGAGFNSTVSQQIDLFFTQTVGTGSCQLHTFNVDVAN